LFSPAPTHVAAQPNVPAPFTPQAQEPAWPRALAETFAPRTAAPSSPVAMPPAPQRPAPNLDMQKLRAEISRLELLVKKLQTELQIERQYNQALELHVRTLTGIEQA